MTAIPSPAFVAMHLGALLSGQDGPLTNPQKRALAYAVEVLTMERMVEPASILDDVINGAPITAVGVLARDDVLAEALRELGEAKAETHKLAGMYSTAADDAERFKVAYGRAQLEGPGAVSASHPDTSRQAAESVAQSAKMERLRVLASVIEDGPASASVVASRLGLVPNQVAARAWELRKGKWLEWRDRPGGNPEGGYVTDVTPHGRAGNVLYLTEHGQAELVRQHGTLEVAAKLLREGRSA